MYRQIDLARIYAVDRWCLRRASSRVNCQRTLQLVEEAYPHTRKIRLVSDNLNTHSIASLHEAFTANEAHRLKQRLEIHYTPRSGSWLSVAEIELGVQRALRSRPPSRRSARGSASWMASRCQV